MLGSSFMCEEDATTRRGRPFCTPRTISNQLSAVGGIMIRIKGVLDLLMGAASGQEDLGSRQPRLGEMAGLVLHLTTGLPARCDLDGGLQSGEIMTL